MRIQYHLYRYHCRKLAALLAILGLAAAASTASSATYYWDTNGSTAGFGDASGTWGINQNWSTSNTGVLVPGVTNTLSADIVNFGNTATGLGAGTVNINGTVNITTINFALGSGTINLSGGIINFANAGTISPNNSGDTISSVISGASTSLSKVNIGTLTLSGDNTYTGMTNLNASRLILTGNNVSATGGMTIAGGGIAEFSSPNSMNGTARNITINSTASALGAVLFGSGFGAGNIPTALSTRIVATSTGAIAADNYGSTNFDFNTAGLTSASLGAVGSVNYTGTLTPSGTTYRLGGGGGTLTIANANAITGANTLVVSGAGTVVLAAANDYTGLTTVGSGTLKLGAAGSGANSPLGTNAAGTTVNAGGVLDLNGFTLGTAEPLTINGTGVSGVAAGALTNTSATAADYSGLVTLGSASRINSAGGTLTLSNTGTITGPTFGLTVGGIGNTTINSIIGTTTGTLTKDGTGTLTLTAANTYTGATTVTSGRLMLDLTTNNTGILAVTSLPTLSGGNLALTGKAGAFNSSQTLSNLTLTANTASTITLDPNGGTGTTLTLGTAWTRGASSTLLIDYSSANSGTRFVKTTAAVTGTGAASNGIFGYLLVKDSAGVTGFATQDGSFNFVRYADEVSGMALDTTSNSATTNFSTLNTVYSAGTLDWTNAGALTNRSVNSLTIDTTNNGGTIEMGAATNILTLTSGAILFKGPNDLTLQGGKVGAAASTVLVHQTGAGTLTITSPISSGAGSLLKDGAGTLVLNGANAYTGTTTVNGGTLKIDGGTSTGIGQVIIGNAAGNSTFSVHSGTATAGNGFNVGNVAGANASYTQDGGTLTISGATNPINLGAAASSSSSFTLSNGTFTVATTAGSAGNIGNLAPVTFTQTGGTFNYNATSNLLLNVAGNINTATTLNISGGTFNMGTAGSTLYLGLRDTATLTVSGAASVNLGLLSLTRSVGSTAGQGIVNLNGGTLQVSSIIKEAPEPGTTGTFNFNGGTLKPSASNTTWIVANDTLTLNVKSGGAIVDTNGFSVTVAQAFANAGGSAFTKKGNGILAFSSTTALDAFTSVNVDIQQGTLNLAALTNLPSFSRLKGDGTLDVGSKTVTLASGGTLLPGNSPGVLDITGNLNVGTILDTAGLTFELGDALVASDNDRVNLTGLLTLDTLNFADFTFTAGTGFGPGIYTLFDAASISGSIGTGSGLIGSYLGTLSIDTNTSDVLLTVSQVPEPSSLIMMIVGIAGMNFIRKRRRDS